MTNSNFNVMKNKRFAIIISFLLIMSYNCLFGQQLNDTIFYDQNWKETDNSNYLYYRIIEKDGKLFSVRDYWLTGDIQMRGVYKSLKREIRHGDFIWYYRNGKPKKKSTFCKNKPIGLTTEYDIDGNLTFEYNNNKELLDNKKEMAEYEAKFQQYLIKNLQYPPYCYQNNIKGRVYVDFYVSKEGKTIKTKVIKSVHQLLDQEAVKIVSEYNNWPIPMYENKPIAVHYTVPVNFTL
jgi:periplasmic protein TonB